MEEDTFEGSSLRTGIHIVLLRNRPERADHELRLTGCAPCLFLISCVTNSFFFNFCLGKKSCQLN